MNLFGFQITRDKKSAKEAAPQPTPVTPVVPGATARTVSSGGWAYGGVNGWDIDIDGTFRTESQLIGKYRDISTLPDLATAIDIICNEAIIVEQGHPPVDIITDELPEQYQAIKETIQDQFQQILKILNFNDECFDLFKRWYVDGKLYFYVTVDPKEPKKGIKSLKYVDPRKIRKVVEYQKTNRDGIDIITGEQTYYLFNDNGLENAQNGVKISEDSIINVKSGLVDANTGNVLSYLYKAIKPANQLKMMEDSLVIYRITRAPERRVFYVDVGNLPAQKAEQYVAQMMQKFRNKVVYDAGTGEIRNNRQFLSCIEDFFLPRREGGKATEIQTLPGGCLSMDTKVPIADGRELSIREISNELNQGKKLWTYSCDPITGKFTLGLISWAGVTHKSAKVMKLTFDNGETLICTPDHKFPVWKKGKTRADKLELNDSIISFQRQNAQIDKDYKNTYTQVYDHETNQWKFVHRVAIEDIQGIDTNLKHRVIHHKDLNRYNNNPENLQQMEWSDHVDLHNSIGFAKYKQDFIDQGRYDEYVEMKKKWSKDAWDRKTDEEKQKIVDALAEGRDKFFANMTPEQYEKFCDNQRQYGHKAQKTRNERLKDPEYRARFIENIKKNCHTPEIRAKKAENATWIIDQRIADVIYEYSYQNYESNLSLQKIANYLNNIPEIVSHYREINKTRISYKGAEQFNIYILGHQICKFWQLQNMDEFKKFVDYIPTTETLHFDDIIVETVMDWIKNGASFEQVEEKANNDKQLLDHFNDINRGIFVTNWDHKFTVSGIKRLLVSYYGAKNWSEIKNQFNIKPAKLKLTDDIAKLIVDLVKNDSNITAQDIVAILNSKSEVVQSMIEHNEYVEFEKFDKHILKTAVCDYYGFEKWANFKKNAKLINHRVVAIEYLDDPIEVGTLTIDKDEIYHDYHTFALCCGVYTFNSNLSQLEDVEYFQKKLYQSLNVPKQRLISDNLNALGRANEITREEIAFNKFIQRLRNNFNTLFKDALRLQLILTNTIKPKEWDEIKNSIYFRYQHDNYFEEMKRLEVMSEQMNQLQQMDTFKGTYFSKNWIVKKVLAMSDDEWQEMKEEIRKEAIDEAQDQQELAMSDETDEVDSSDDSYEDESGESDDEYDDFKSGESTDSDDSESTSDDESEDAEQTGDNTDTIINVPPNPGDKPFKSPATPGLTAGH